MQPWYGCWLVEICTEKSSQWLMMVHGPWRIVGLLVQERSGRCAFLIQSFWRRTRFKAVHYEASHMDL